MDMKFCLLQISATQSLHKVEQQKCETNFTRELFTFINKLNYQSEMNENEGREEGGRWVKISMMMGSLEKRDLKMD
jgi:hypothetical protein